jgi:peptidoglycan/LPS O-acetylase OafA/YrhL
MHLYKAAPLNTPSWSLSTEWWVYMIFPFLVPTFARLKVVGKLAATALLRGCFVLLRYWVGPKAGPFPGKPTLNMIQDFGFFRCLAGFLLGMLVFECYRSRIARNVLQKSASFIVVSAGCLLAMHLGAMDLAIVAFFPFILLTAAYNETGVKRVLDTRPLQRLGDWSFSIYMVHVPIILMFMVVEVRAKPGLFADFMKALSTPPDYRLGAILCPILIVLTVLVAALTYRFVEVPARNYLNLQFATRRKRVLVEATEV